MCATRSRFPTSACPEENARPRGCRRAQVTRLVGQSVAAGVDQQRIQSPLRDQHLRSSGPALRFRRNNTESMKFAFPPESSVEITNTIVISVCHCKFRAPLERASQSTTKPNLVPPGKDALVIFDEPIDIVAHGIRRIHEYEVTFDDRINGSFEVLAYDLGYCQCLRPLRKVITREHHGRFGSDGNIELTAPVFSVKTIPTRPVQI